jgi:hypothetical protein
VAHAKNAGADGGDAARAKRLGLRRPSAALAGERDTRGASFTPGHSFGPAQFYFAADFPGFQGRRI